MATVRGFLQRTLPALLALMLAGLTVPLGSAPGDPVTSPHHHAAATTHTGTVTAQVADDDPAVLPGVADVAALIDPAADASVVAGAQQTPRAQLAAGVHGSRAPPSTLA